MTDGVFETGDVVRVKGIRGPEMVVFGVGSPNIVGIVYTAQTVHCLWFDDAKRPQKLFLEPEILEKVTDSEGRDKGRESGEAEQVAAADRPRD